MSSEPTPSKPMESGSRAAHAGQSGRGDAGDLRDAGGISTHAPSNPLTRPRSLRDSAPPSPTPSVGEITSPSDRDESTDPTGPPALEIYRVIGVQKDTLQDVVLQVRAASRANAKVKAELRNVVVTEVELIETIERVGGAGVTARPAEESSLATPPVERMGEAIDELAPPREAASPTDSGSHRGERTAGQRRTHAGPLVGAIGEIRAKAAAEAGATHEGESPRQHARHADAAPGDDARPERGIGITQGVVAVHARMEAPLRGPESETHPNVDLPEKMYCRRCRARLEVLNTPTQHCQECGLSFHPADPTSYRNSRVRKKRRFAIAMLTLTLIAVVGAGAYYGYSKWQQRKQFIQRQLDARGPDKKAPEAGKAAKQGAEDPSKAVAP